MPDKNFVTDVIKFCEWLKPYMEELNRPVPITEIMNEDYFHVMHNLRCEMHRLATMRYMKIARESYNDWALHN